MPQYVPALPVAFFNFALDNFPRELESFLNLPVSGEGPNVAPNEPSKQSANAEKSPDSVLAATLAPECLPECHSFWGQDRNHSSSCRSKESTGAHHASGAAAHQQPTRVAHGMSFIDYDAVRCPDKTVRGGNAFLAYAQRPELIAAARAATPLMPTAPTAPERPASSERDVSSTVELEAIERDACSPDSFRSRSSKGSPIDPNQRMLALVESFRKIEATDRTDRSGGQNFKRRAGKGASSMRSV